MRRIMKITHKYKWMDLSADGLLKDPENVGPYYSQTNVNAYGSFDTEEEAYAAFIEFKKLYGYSCPSELILVKFCTVE